MTAWLEGMKLDIAPLRESNDLLGDRAALDAAWERDGYLFFRDVLDQDAVAQLRETYLEELEKFHVVDPGDPTGRYNGGDLGPLPKFPSGIQGLFERAAWRQFAGNPEVNQFVTKMLGERPYWVPVVGYRVSPPGDPVAADRFVYVHQDGFFNPGIPFRNCWVPLSEMDETVGGIAVAEGCHKQNFHDTTNPPAFPVPVHDIPMGAWRRADYHPGDLLIMHLDLPHTGISNITEDRFRLSLDIRMLPSSGDLPTIGKVITIDTTQVTVEDHEGDRHRFAIDDATYCRGLGPNKLTTAEIPQQITPGNEVIVASEGKRALVVRPASY